MEGFFLGESVPVNEKLSEIFLQLHISEKSGRGVPKIIEEYGKDAFSFREQSIVVTMSYGDIEVLLEYFILRKPYHRVEILQQHLNIAIAHSV